MQSKTKQEMFKILDTHYQLLLNEKIKPASNKLHFFSQPGRMFWTYYSKKYICTLNSKKDATLKLQTISNEKNLQEFFFMDKLLSANTYIKSSIP